MAESVGIGMHHILINPKHLKEFFYVAIGIYRTIRCFDICIVSYLSSSFEWMLYKLELLDYKARERAGTIPAIHGVPVPVLLQEEAASEVFSCSFFLLFYIWDSFYKITKLLFLCSCRFCDLNHLQQFRQRFLTTGRRK
jgi:hypothetical protein